jgi:hypothetical protein
MTGPDRDEGTDGMRRLPPTVAAAVSAPWVAVHRTHTDQPSGTEPAAGWSAPAAAGPAADAGPPVDAAPRQAVTAATFPGAGSSATTPAPTATIPAPTATAAGTATGAASDLPRADPLAQPLAAGDAPPGPPGTDDGELPPPGGRYPAVRGSARLAPLRIGWHAANVPALAQLAPSPAGSGLILGSDAHRRLVPVRLFRSVPTTVALVGGIWAARFVAFRALAVGARVLVVTAEPQAWQGFGERATGQPDRVRVTGQEPAPAAAGAAHQPVLVVYDLGPAGPRTPAAPGPWQTRLTLLRRLDQSGVAAVQEADLVVLPRLGEAEARLAGAALRLPDRSVGLLQAMAEDMAAVIGGGADTYLWLTQTELERQHLGSPGR